MKCIVCTALNTRDELRKHTNAQTIITFARKVTPVLDWVDRIVSNTTVENDIKIRESLCFRHDNSDQTTTDALSLNKTLQAMKALEDTCSTNDIRLAAMKG